jgi:hypothetical protein
MEGYILEYSQVDVNAPGGERHERYIAIAETRERAFAAAGGHWGIRHAVLDWGPLVLQQARSMGVGDNEAKPLSDPTPNAEPTR